MAQLNDVRPVIDNAAGIVVWICNLIITVGIALLIAACVVSKFWTIRVGIPVLSETVLAWLAGAFWLYRGGKLF